MRPVRGVKLALAAVIITAAIVLAGVIGGAHLRQDQAAIWPATVIMLCVLCWGQDRALYGRWSRLRREAARLEAVADAYHAWELRLAEKDAILSAIMEGPDQ